MDDWAKAAGSIFPNSSQLQSFTVEAWIYPTKAGSLIATDDAYNLILFSGNASTSANNGVGIKYTLYQTGSSISSVTEYRDVSLGQWNHVALTFDASARKYWISINGVLTKTPTDYSANQFFSSASEIFSIGRRSTDTTGGFSGLIREVRVSSVVRYAANFTPSDSFSPDGNTKGLWHFDEPPGSTSFNDASGIGNTLTGLNGAKTATVQTLPPLAQNMEMVWIEPGKFTMGSPSSEVGRSSDEGPQHEVTITKGFYLGKYEVTQGQWQSVMGTTPWVGQSNGPDNPDNPAAYVSWDDAQVFVKKLNTDAGDSLYRLPTEAEREYACRAGTTTRWSFGEDESLLGDYAWYYVNASNVREDYRHKVGMKKPNPWGLYDLYGNVSELVQDWYGPYTSIAQVDPQGPASGSNRIRRGGTWGDNNVQFSRSAYRSTLSLSVRYITTGLRLLRQAK